MYGLEGRIERLLIELSSLLNKGDTVVSDVEIRKGRLSFPTDVSQITDGYTAYHGEAWSGEGFDDYALFRFIVQIPEIPENENYYLHITTNKAGGHNMVRPQMMLYIGSDAMHGLDTNHERVCMNAYAGKTVTAYVYAFSGLPKKTPYGARIDMSTEEGVRLYVRTLTREKTLEDLYYSIKTPFAYLQYFGEESAEYKKILNALSDTLSIVDFRVPHSDDFYASAEKALAFLGETLYSEENFGTGKATLVGHTHIDVAWLWRYEHTRDKAMRSFATELALLDRYDEHRFMSGQAQLYQFVKEDDLSLYARIKEAIKQGKWEAEGGMWVEPDMNLCSGESIVRQILYGKRFFHDEFGVDSRVLWLPDVFGYTASLPQILKKSGIDYFMTSKLATNERNRFPFDTFRWRGIDGSEILSHCTSYLRGAYDPNVENGEMLNGWRNYKQKDINDDILLPFGFADGGGGVTEEQLETLRRVSRGIPGATRVKIKTVREYFEALDGRVSGSSRLPVYSGEIYYENHRGTYTSMARIKKQNRKCEQLFSNAEWLWALSECFSPAPFPKEEFMRGAKNMMINQFHDVLPGTSIYEVYEDADALYKEAFAIGEGISERALSALQMEKAESALTVVNPFSEEATGYVPYKEGYVYAENIPAKGYATVELVQSAPAVPVTVDGLTVENAFYKIVFSKDGGIDSLFDKRACRECFKPGERANRLRIFEDKPSSGFRGDLTDNEDNWNLDIHYTLHEYSMSSAERVYIKAASDEWVAVRAEWTYMSSRIVQDTVVYARSPRIDFQTEIDWYEHHQVLKACFPVDVNTTRASYEIPFGYIERPTVYNTAWDETRFEVCGHKWADVSDGGYGVALLNDSKYGYSAEGSTLSLTLLRAGCSPNPMADKEKHTFTYSILPHMGSIKEAEVVKEAYLLNNPLFVAGGKVGRKDAPKRFSLFSASGAVLDTVKPAEDGDGWILRFYEAYNTKGRVSLIAGKPIAFVKEVDLMENDVEGRAVSILPSGELSFEIAPFEIVSLRVRFA